VVLAAGAVETTRLLFASAGFALHSSTRWSWLGRGFMDHLSVRMSRFRPGDSRRFGRMFAPIFARGAQHTPRMLLKPELLEREGLLGCYGHWEVHSGPDSTFSLLREKLRAFQSGHLRVSVDDLLRLTTGMGELVRLAHGVIVKRRRFFERDAQIYLRIDVEQLPNPESRIIPIDECDSFGLPRVALDWRVSSLEQRTAAYAAARLGKELRRLGIGELEPFSNPFESGIPWGELKGDSFHMMGGTRMARSAEDGVVDTNCQVFGTENLFVASTSAFPTGGMANPTLLLLSLTLRLAAYMTDRYQRQGS
jgi:GMC oxidoreductase